MSESNATPLTGPRFPPVKGRNLNHDWFTLPEDIGADYAVVTIAYKQRQQLDVNTWIPAMRQLVEKYDNVIFYELPTIQKMPKISQAWIDGGMRAGIPDPYTRSTTITLYINKHHFKNSLKIDSEDSINTLIIDRHGNIYWREDGRATAEKLASLEKRLAELLGSLDT